MAAPDVAKPVPVQHNLAAVLVEIRDVQVAVTVPHNTCKMPPITPPLEYSQG